MGETETSTSFDSPSPTHPPPAPASVPAAPVVTASASLPVSASDPPPLAEAEVQSFAAAVSAAAQADSLLALDTNYWDVEMMALPTPALCFSGHAAFPGGKADSADESPYQIARREAFEEIGLPMDDSKLPAPFKLEFLCYLPHSLARNGLAVRPCVALLHNPLTQSQPSSSSTTAAAAGGSLLLLPIFAAATAAATTTTTTTTLHSSPLATTANPMVPRLDAKEVAAVFSAPFSSFLRDTDAPVPAGSSAPGLPPGHWYDGTWIHWKGEPWRVHNFYRYKVWGMTAKILVEAASCAYGTTPTFEHNPVWGDEKIILMAHDEGQFFDRPSTRIRVTGDGAPASGGDMTPTEEAVEEAKRAEPAKI
ncbi:unnamed protein product [Parascedosporium putredinis]|uniref:Nudix hydrolase domain-containing protein n=1 Tax=Parascedosporium putredinis TaxID=1442378 RepID=A0A9P1H494_9PEZI|nr:unnamed protein product [Parascedosporium putredinis]CAI7998042.1 unnamed protein product [Parascedosporium putredinis]